MKILIEEYRYDAALVRRYLHDIDELDVVGGMVSVSYVGYFYNNSPGVSDCVFILPKVLIDANSKVFGKYLPEDIIDLDKQKDVTDAEKKFLYEFAVWIYRAITVFKNSQRDTSIIRHKQVVKVGKGHKRLANTYLDILLSLIQFNKENQDFFMFVLKNIHSGFNKINWSRTISKSTAIIQNGEPIYLNPVNKKRQINFDEELLVIFFSILNYISEEYGFEISLNCNYDLIKGKRFEHYLNRFGMIRLRQIKYKYFSDKALQLWELCYAFFEQTHQVKINSQLNEYLLVKNFNIVFEAIIDELIADRIPQKDKRLRELKEQPDGKMVDHIYQWQNLTNNEQEDKNIYYIGDSKYYKRGNAIGKESVYKQFTYARNVIQWNIDLFNDGTDEEKKGHILLRDDITEGYNIIPNFFISAQQNTLEKKDDIHLTDKKEKYFFSRQFENRLFDRDTFLIAHYDVNFLFIIALYGRNNQSEKEIWKRKVRKMFRKEIQSMLKEKFLFYALTPHEDVNADKYIRENFQFLLGKVFKPFEDDGEQQYFSLALRNPESLTKPQEQELRRRIETENDGICHVIDQYFYRASCDLGVNPSTLEELPKVTHTPMPSVPKQFLPQYFFEAFPNATFLIGCYKNKEHLNWIFGRTNKRDNMYNIRIGKERSGGIAKHKAKKAPDFLFLYNVENPTTEGLMMFKVRNAADTSLKFMQNTGYPNPQGNYVSYILEDMPITFGEFDIVALLEEYKSAHPDTHIGEPIFLTGKEIIKYRVNNVI